MSAAIYRLEGNAHFAKKDWPNALESYTRAIELENTPAASAPLFSNRSATLLHLGRLEEAWNDVRTCIDRKPEWSKGYARGAEVLCRKQDFELADVLYGMAIERAEDPATRARYQAALKVARQTGAEHEKASGTEQPMKMSSRWTRKLSIAISFGYVPRVGGGLQFLQYAYTRGEEGFTALDKALIKRTGTPPRQKLEGNAHTAPGQECILLDDRALVVPPSSDPSYPLRVKLVDLSKFDHYAFDVYKYLFPTPWSAKAIVADLDKSLPTQKWDMVRRRLSVLTRDSIVTSWLAARSKRHASAVHNLQFAYDVLVEGNKIWADVSIDDKGSSFRPTMLIMVEAALLQYQLEAYRDAQARGKPVKQAFTLEAIEKRAKHILAENPQSRWGRQATDVTRFAYFVLPTARAYLGLGSVASFRASEPLQGLGGGKVALADLDQAKIAARYFDMAAKLLPDDYHLKAAVLFMALEQHLRAGGKTIEQVFELAAQAETSFQDLSRWFEEYREGGEKYGPREFVELQIDSLQKWLETPAARPCNGVPAVQQKIKAIPTLNLHGMPPSFNPDAVLTRAFWHALPGEVGVADVVEH
ncbi:hypothetical protein JCM10212_002949 [Sporobolomyces blumeae]